MPKAIARLLRLVIRRTKGAQLKNPPEQLRLAWQAAMNMLYEGLKQNSTIRVFQQIGGEAMPQSMRGYALRKVGGFASLPADCEDCLSCDRALWWITREEPDRRSVALPVGAQHLKQLGRQHHLAILAALALTNADDLSLAVDIRHPQVRELGDSQAGGINGHQDGAVFEVAGGVEDGCDFGRTQDYRQFFLVARVRNAFNHPVAVEDVMIEEAQRAHRLIEHRPGDLFALNQI
jgi:hypothetical protein